MFLVNYNEERFYVKKDLEHYDSADYRQFHELSEKIHFKYLKSHRCYEFKLTEFYEFTLWCQYYNWHLIYLNGSEQYTGKFDNFYERETKFFRGVELDESVLNPGVKLYNYQKQGILFALGRTRHYNMDAPGAGKSIQAIVAFCNLYKQGKIDGIFLISKNGLSYHWLKEILIFTNVFKEEDILLVNNENKKNVFELHTDKKVIIVPNHLLTDMMLSYRKIKPKKTEDGKKKRIKASKLRWKAVMSIKEKWQKKCLALVVDEAHCFKYSTSTRSKSLAAYIHEFEYRSFYSATPAINRFEDFYFQMKLLDPAILNETEGSFLLKIGNKLGGTYDPWEVKKYNSEAVLYFKNRMLPSTIKRLKEELPEMKTKRIISPIYLQMGYTHRRIYNLYAKREKQGITLTQKIDAENLQNKFVNTCLALDNPFLIKEKYSKTDKDVEFILRKYKFEDDTRITFLDELCEDIIDEKGEKLVVFDTHPLTLDLLAERYARYHPLIIHGKKNTKEKERSDIESAFNDKDSKHKIIFLSSMTSSAGINLQKGANRVVFFTQPWNTTDYSQAIERTYRIVSEKDTIVYLLVFDKSLDTYRLGKNLNRVEFADSLFNEALDENDVNKLLNFAPD